MTVADDKVMIFTSLTRTVKGLMFRLPERNECAGSQRSMEEITVIN